MNNKHTLPINSDIAMDNINDSSVHRSMKMLAAVATALVNAATALAHAPALTAAHTPSTTVTTSDASDAPAILLIMPSSMVIGITKWHEVAPLSE